MKSLPHATTALSAIVLSGALILSTTANADDAVIEQIEMGLEHYHDGDYGAAATELEFALNDIRKLISASIAETFPQAPSGWRADEAEAQEGGQGAAAMFGGGSMIERNYFEEDGRGKITASLAIDNPMIQGMAAMFNNPALAAAQPNTERVRIGRESALVKWEPNRDRGEATLLLDGRILMQIKGQNIESQDTLVELLQSWDLDAVREKAAR